MTEIRKWGRQISFDLGIEISGEIMRFTYFSIALTIHINRNTA